MNSFKCKHLTWLIVASALTFTTAGCSSNGESTTAQNQASSSASAKKLPSDLPKEIPLYDAEVYSVSDSDSGKWSFILEAPATKEEVVKSLQAIFTEAGWNIKNKLDLGDAGGQFQAVNGTYDVRIVYTPNPTTRDTATPTMMLSYKIQPDS